MKFVKEPLFSMAQEWNWWAHFSGIVTCCVLVSPIVARIMGGTSITSLLVTVLIVKIGGITLEILQGTVLKAADGHLIGASMKDLGANLAGAVVWGLFTWYSFCHLLHTTVASWYIMVAFLALVGFLVYGSYVAYYANMAYKQTTYMKRMLTAELQKALKAKKGKKK